MHPFFHWYSRCRKSQVLTINQILCTLSASLLGNLITLHESWSSYTPVATPVVPLNRLGSTGSIDHEILGARLRTQGLFLHRCTRTPVRLHRYVGNVTFSTGLALQIWTSIAKRRIRSITRRCTSGTFIDITMSFLPAKLSTYRKKSRRLSMSAGNLSSWRVEEQKN